MQMRGMNPHQVKKRAIASRVDNALLIHRSFEKGGQIYFRDRKSGLKKGTDLFWEWAWWLNK